MQPIQEQLSSFTSSLFNAELNNLNIAREKGIITEKEYARKVAEIKRKQAIADKAQAAFNISINIAEAITKALTSGPIIGQILGGISAALGFAQLAVVLGTPLPEIPEFGKGGSVSKRLGLIKGRSHKQGGELINVEGDEYVMNKNAVRRYGVSFMDKINTMQLNHNFLIPDISHYNKLEVSFDKLSGDLSILTKYIKRGNGDRVEYNNRLINVLRRSGKNGY